MNIISFNEKAVKEYLDTRIRYWRKERDENNCEFAVYYIDAFQSVRSSLFGEILKNEN